MDNEREMIQEIARLRGVIEGGFIALIAYQLHAADRARSIDHCLRTAAQLVEDGASLNRQQPST